MFTSDQIGKVVLYSDQFGLNVDYSSQNTHSYFCDVLHYCNQIRKVGEWSANF